MGSQRADRLRKCVLKIASSSAVAVMADRTAYDVYGIAIYIRYLD